jgi:hypothetical protein
MKQRSGICKVYKTNLCYVYKLILVSCLFYSVCVCHFASKSSEETYVLVGVASDVILNPRSCSGGSIHTFKLLTMPDGGQKLELQHTV